MLSNDIFERAKKQLDNKPTYLELLFALWPLVKDYDFNKNKHLDIDKPMHYQLTALGKNSQILFETRKISYSHRAYRTVLRLLGLVPSSNFSKSTLRIRKKHNKIFQN